MNHHCIVSSDERRNAHSEGLREARTIEIESHANGIVEQLSVDIAAARRDGLIPINHIIYASPTTLELLKLIASQLGDEVFALAESLVTADWETSDD